MGYILYTLNVYVYWLRFVCISVGRYKCESRCFESRRIDGCTSPKRSANATEELLKRVDRVVAKLQVRCYALFRMSHSNVVIS